MKALCWEDVIKLFVEQVPIPSLHNDQDVIVRLTAARPEARISLSSAHTSPFMRSGDVIGHEFLGTLEPYFE